MGLPTLEGGPYIFNVGNRFHESANFTCSKRVLLEIKNALVALGGAGVNWQVVASSDASSVKNIGDADPDLWINIGDLAYGLGAHSWVILEHQTTGLQLCIDYRSSYFYACYAYCSRGGTFSTDGTTSAIPSATDTQEVWASSFHSGMTTVVDACIHVQESADHRCTRVMVHYKLTSDLSCHFYPMLIEHVADSPSEWSSLDKLAVVRNVYPAHASTVPEEQTPILLHFVQKNIYAYLVTDAPYEGWNATQPLVECYDDFNSVNRALLVCKLNTNFETLGGFPVSSIGLYRPDVSNGGYYGRVRDLYLAPYYAESLSTYPKEEGTRLWVKFGCFLLPWNGTQVIEPF